MSSGSVAVREKTKRRRSSLRLRPAVKDQINLRAGIALSSAAGRRRKYVAAAVRRSNETFNQWCAGSPGNPVARTLEIACTVEYPERLVVEMEIVAVRAELKGRSVDSLATERDDLLRRQEPLAHAQYQVALHAGDAEGLRRWLVEKARIETRAAAIIDEIADRPRND